MAERPAVELREPPRTLLRVLNPLVRSVLRSPVGRLMGSQLVLLTMTGRRTGRRISVPVGAYTDGGVLVVLTGAPWRHNLQQKATVEVHASGRRRSGSARLEQDPREVARLYRAAVDQLGPRRAGRVALKVNVRRSPSVGEIEAAVSGRGAVLISLDD